jgi:hypothetical protein
VLTQIASHRPPVVSPGLDYLHSHVILAASPNPNRGTRMAQPTDEVDVVFRDRSWQNFAPRRRWRGIVCAARAASSPVVGCRGRNRIGGSRNLSRRMRHRSSAWSTIGDLVVDLLPEKLEVPNNSDRCRRRVRTRGCRRRRVRGSHQWGAALRRRDWRSEWPRSSAWVMASPPGRYRRAAAFSQWAASMRSRRASPDAAEGSVSGPDVHARSPRRPSGHAAREHTRPAAPAAPAPPAAAGIADECLECGRVGARSFPSGGPIASTTGSGCAAAGGRRKPPRCR